MRSLLLLPLLFAATAGLAADPQPDAAPVTERMSTLLVFGNDACPKGEGDEIVVCARLPENERYRVPKRFRGKKRDDAGGQSWSNRVETMEWIGRQGTPNSCSVVGSGGQTGCFQQFLRQSRDERREAERANAGIP